MWTNQINLSTLLMEANGDASMSRFQLLVFSLVVAVGIYLYMINNSELPKIDQSVLTLLGISASTYAAGKGISFSRPEGVTKPGTQQKPASDPDPKQPDPQRQADQDPKTNSDSESSGNSDLVHEDDSAAPPKPING